MFFTEDEMGIKNTVDWDQQLQINNLSNQVQNMQANVDNLLKPDQNFNSITLNMDAEPVESSAVLGYDGNGKVIPVHAVYDPEFPAGADFLATDAHGTAYKGMFEQEVNEGEVPATSHAVLNALNGVNIRLQGLINQLTVESDYFNSSSPLNYQNCTGVVYDIFNSENTVIGNKVSLGLDENNVLHIGTFTGCFKFNVMMTSTFANCSSLNQNIAIPDSVIGMTSTFANCSSLNQNIAIPDSVIGMTFTFANCSSLNQNIAIPNSVTEMLSTFADCSSLNQNIAIPDSVIGMPEIFANCSSLNQNIAIPNSVTNIYSTFEGCSSLNQNIAIPNSMTEMFRAFFGCTAMAGAYIHISKDIAIGNTGNYIYNCLVNNYTGVNFYGRVLNDME